MVELRLIEGGGQGSSKNRPSLVVAPRNPDDDIPVLGYLPASPVAPAEEVFKTPHDFDRSQLWQRLLGDFLDQFPVVSDQDVGDMISQAAVEVHQAGRPLTLSSVSDRFWEVWNQAMREERRSHMRKVLGPQMISETTSALILPKEWEVFTNESPPQGAAVPAAAPQGHLILHGNPKRAIEERLNQPSLLTLHLRGIALRFGLPSSEVDGEVETFLKRLWSNPTHAEKFEFAVIVERFEMHLEQEWERVNELVVGPETSVVDLAELEYRDLREGAIEALVDMGVSYEAAQRLFDEVVEDYGSIEGGKELVKRAQKKANRWLRRQARSEQALKARLKHEQQQGVLTSSEIGIQSLVRWLVESHGLNRDDANQLVWSVLQSWPTTHPQLEMDLGNMGTALEDALNPA